MLEQGAPREQHLGAAVDALADSGATLDHGWALVSLGIERRETHLGHAYTKLGIKSRRHLAQAVGG